MIGWELEWLQLLKDNIEGTTVPSLLQETDL